LTRITITRRRHRPILAGSRDGCSSSDLLHTGWCDWLCHSCLFSATAQTPGLDGRCLPPRLPFVVRGFCSGGWHHPTRAHHYRGRSRFDPACWTHYGTTGLHLFPTLDDVVFTQDNRDYVCRNSTTTTPPRRNMTVDLHRGLTPPRTIPLALRCYRPSPYHPLVPSFTTCPPHAGHGCLPSLPLPRGERCASRHRHSNLWMKNITCLFSPLNAERRLYIVMRRLNRLMRFTQASFICSSAPTYVAGDDVGQRSVLCLISC